MARPKNVAYTPGKYHFTKLPDGRGYVARAYYNDKNGKRRDCTARGATQPAAKRALNAKIEAAREQYVGGDQALNSSTRLEVAARLWLDWKAQERPRGRPLTQRTLDDYAGYVRRCISGSTLGNLSVTEANNVGQIEVWLSGIASERGETAARQARKVLAGVLALAERREAIEASVMHRVRTPGAAPDTAGDRKCKDPDCDLNCGKRHLDVRRAFTLEEARAIQAAADAATSDIGDLVAFLFGTGARISEALHCTAWADLDLIARTIRIRGTKSDSADRVLALSDELIERLAGRAAEHGTTGLVFGVTRYQSKMGQPRDRNNTCKQIRKALAAAGIGWAGTHTFRRTVASWMDSQGASLAEIADQLGHADTNVTAQYLGRRTKPTRAASIMTLGLN